MGAAIIDWVTVLRRWAQPRRMVPIGYYGNNYGCYYNNYGQWTCPQQYQY
jgi:hypothetical protein